jgi:ketosteroid isomerase-like protein
VNPFCKSLAIVTFFALTAARPQAARDTTGGIRTADQDWARVFAAKNLDASVAICAPDGAVLAPNAPIAAGREEIRKLFQGFFAIPGFQITWHPTKIEVARSGEIGYSSGVYEMQFKDASGKPASDTGKYVTIWKRTPDGKWQVVRDIFNSDLPPPQSQAAR